MKRFLVILLIVAVVAAGGYAVASRRAASQGLPEGIVTAPVERQDIDALVTATGSLLPARQQALAFTGTGRVAEVLVAEGQEVQASDVLARLDDTDLRLALRQAEAALAASEASLARAQVPPSVEDIAAAEAAVAAAQASLSSLYRGPSEEDLRLAQLQVDQAKNSLYGAQGNRDATNGNPLASGGVKAQAEAQVLNAELAVTIAELNLKKLQQPPDPGAVRAAESQLAQAQANLTRLLNTPSPEDLRAAEAQVAQARASVDLAKRRLDDAVLVAPFSGQVAGLRLFPGDMASPATPVGTLVDVSGYYLEVVIDETEIGRIATGQPARLVLDAYPEATLEGTVSRVDLVGTAAQGIVNYTVRVDLADATVPLMPNMTAMVDIVVSSKEQALVVPNRALLRDSAGKYVEVVSGDALQRVDVTTGLANDEVTEILSGLEPGQEVVVSRPRESLFAGSPFGG